MKETTTKEGLEIISAANVTDKNYKEEVGTNSGMIKETKLIRIALAGTIKETNYSNGQLRSSQMP